jgi:uncharacterized protein (TIGR03067 family)
MTTRHLVLVSACVLAAGGCGNFRDRSLLSAGTWTLERMELGGRPETNESFEVEFSPNGNAVKITVGNKVHKGTYELQSDRDPKEIDIKPDATNSEDKHLYGIYALDADGQGLLMCLSQTKRPKKFETKPNNDWVLVRLRKQ